jgi:hypothetical protein
MGKDNNIVHQYFRKDFEDFKVLVKVNPIQYKGTEITIFPDREMQMRDIDFDEQIFEDLKEDGFVECNPLEFNLHLSGLV